MAHILVTDDNKLTRDILRAILEMEGHTVSEADGGEACLARVDASRPDLLILDLRMPKLDGWTSPVFCVPVPIRVIFQSSR